MNVQALTDMLSTPFDTTKTPADAPQIHVYEANKDVQGDINYSVLSTSNISWRVSQNQWCATAGGALQVGNNVYYDAVIKDFCYQPGILQGGMHGGEPLSGQLPDLGSAVSSNVIAELFTGEKAYAASAITGNPLIPPPISGSFPTQVGPGPRDPTYQHTGHAADFRFKLPIKPPG